MQLTRRNLIVWAACAALCSGAGVAAAQAIAESPPPAAITQTKSITTFRTQTQFVTVRVRGKVIRHHDHVLVVFVPRVVFHTHSAPRRRIVVPAHIVRIVRRPATPTGPPVALVDGVAPLPVTVTVPETVTVPGPVQTVVSTYVTTQVVPTTTTETSVTTLTVTVPLTDATTQEEIWHR